MATFWAKFGKNWSHWSEVLFKEIKLSRLKAHEEYKNLNFSRNTFEGTTMHT